MAKNVVKNVHVTNTWFEINHVSQNRFHLTTDAATASLVWWTNSVNFSVTASYEKSWVWMFVMTSWVLVDSLAKTVTRALNPMSSNGPEVTRISKFLYKFYQNWPQNLVTMTS